MNRFPRPARACPRLSSLNARGEWAEAAFLTKAVGMGFTACRPFCDRHRFDFLLISLTGKVSRVQVRSSWKKQRNRAYDLTLITHGRRYHANEVDFIIGYIVPTDAWYVIPVRGLRCTHASVFPHVEGTQSQWERYREAWDLMQ